MLAFGVYDVFSPIDLTTTGQLLFRCTGIGNRVAVVVVSLSRGNSNNVQTRTLRELGGGSGVLNYNVFSDPGHTQIWGGALAGSAPVTVTVRNNTLVSLTMYGHVPAHQDVPTARYSDLLFVTLNF
jgi:spore coat protein U-like protein